MRKLLFVLMVSATLVSCERVLFGEDQASSDPFVNFEYLWEELDRKYSYFELKGLDWNEVRVRYRAMLSRGMSEDSLFSVLAGMMSELRDDHSNLIAPFNISVYNLPLQHPVNFFPRTIQEHYLTDSRITGAFQHGAIANGEVAYVRYGSFMSMFSEQELDHILDRYRNTKGLILDLRNNGGGSIFNVPALLERFNSTSRTVGYFITRNGPAHTDFSAPKNFNVGVHGGVTYSKPVMVLIDRGSYSATTMFALACKSIPSLTLVGDTTGGGGGAPNGGMLPNGWSYRFSVSQLLDMNMDNFAESGVPPDISAAFDFSDLNKDEIIERALQELL
jgi:hypothetical protein